MLELLPFPLVATSLLRALTQAVSYPGLAWPAVGRPSEPLTVRTWWAGTDRRTATKGWTLAEWRSRAEGRPIAPTDLRAVAEPRTVRRRTRGRTYRSIELWPLEVRRPLSARRTLAVAPRTITRPAPLTAFRPSWSGSRPNRDVAAASRLVVVLHHAARALPSRPTLTSILRAGIHDDRWTLVLDRRDGRSDAELLKVRELLEQRFLQTFGHAYSLLHDACPARGLRVCRLTVVSPAAPVLAELRCKHGRSANGASRYGFVPVSRGLRDAATLGRDQRAASITAVVGTNTEATQLDHRLIQSATHAHLSVGPARRRCLVGPTWARHGAAPQHLAAPIIAETSGHQSRRARPPLVETMSALPFHAAGLYLG